MKIDKSKAIDCTFYPLYKEAIYLDCTPMFAVAPDDWPKEDTHYNVRSISEVWVPDDFKKCRT